MIWLRRGRREKLLAAERVHALMNELEAEGLASEPGLEGKGSRHPNKRDSWEPHLPSALWDNC